MSLLFRFAKTEIDGLFAVSFGLVSHFPPFHSFVRNTTTETNRTEVENTPGLDSNGLKDQTLAIVIRGFFDRKPQTVIFPI